MFKHASRGWFVAIVAVVAFLASTSGVAFAVLFPDVSVTNPFAEDIDAITDSGIATGFPDGTYRPTNTVNRQQMAAFLHRGGGRIGYDDGSASTNIADDTTAILATVNLTAGATGASATGGFVMLTGTVEANQSATNTCPCHFVVRIKADGVEVDQKEGDIEVDPSEDSQVRGRVAGTVAVPIAKDDTVTYTLEVTREHSVQGNGFYRGELTAIYAPFAANGAQDLDG